MIDFLYALIELFFAIYYGCGAMSQNVYSSAVFTGGRPLCTQLLPGQGGHPLSTILGIRKLETLGYPMVKTASLCVPRFDTVLECDGQTDGYAVACTVLAACCKNERQLIAGVD